MKEEKVETVNILKGSIAAIQVEIPSKHTKKLFLWANWKSVFWSCFWPEDTNIILEETSGEVLKKVIQCYCILETNNK